MPKFKTNQTVYIPSFQIKGTVLEYLGAADGPEYVVRLADDKETVVPVPEADMEPIKTDLDGDVDVDALFGAAVEDAAKPKKSKPKSKPQEMVNPEKNISEVTMMRRLAVRALEKHDPDAFKKYGEIKYGNGDNPSLEDRIKAYEFAIKRALEIGYNTPNA